MSSRSRHNRTLPFPIVSTHSFRHRPQNLNLFWKPRPPPKDSTHNPTAFPAKMRSNSSHGLGSISAISPFRIMSSTSVPGQIGVNSSSVGGVSNSLLQSRLANTIFGREDPEENEATPSAASGDETTPPIRSQAGIENDEVNNAPGSGDDNEMNNNEQEDKDGICFKDGKLWANGSPAMWSPTHLKGPWLSVPKDLGFTLDTGSKCLVGKLRLKNSSPLFISFHLIPTTPSVFNLTPRIGILSPKHSVEVVLSTRKQVPEEDDKDLTEDKAKIVEGRKQVLEDVLTSGLYILATPIYFSSQVNLAKVKVLWKAYGSPLFPPEGVEHHLISRMILPDSLLGDYSVLEKGVWGNYSGIRKTFPSFKTMVQRRERGRQVAISEREFTASWMPSEVGRRQGRALVNHLTQLTQAAALIKEEMAAATTISRMTWFTILIFFLGYFILHYLTIVKDFGPNGVWIMDSKNKGK